MKEWFTFSVPQNILTFLSTNTTNGASRAGGGRYVIISSLSVFNGPVVSKNTFSSLHQSLCPPTTSFGMEVPEVPSLVTVSKVATS
jgi:hypothetical protein